MRRILSLFIMIIFFLSSCHRNEHHPTYYCDEIFPFGITSTTDGFYIYPDGSNINFVRKADFIFFRTKINENCFSGIGQKIQTVEYDYNKKKLLFVKAKSNNLYRFMVKIVRTCQEGFQTYWKLSAVIGTEQVKFMPFENFDSPILHFSAVQSQNNFFYYNGENGSCGQLPKYVDKYVPVVNEYGCYTIMNSEGLYCSSATGEVEVFSGNVKKFFALLWDKGIYRTYVLDSNNRFFIYDYIPGLGKINKIYEEDEVRDVFPSLSHIYNKMWVVNGSKVIHDPDSYYYIESTDYYDKLVKEVNKRKYFYLLKTTDDTLVEILKPNFNHEYERYWKAVSGVSYYFMDITLPVEGKNYLPRGIIFSDGDVYLRDFGREYHFPFKIKKLWMVKYPGKIWDGNYSGFMVGSDGYMVLVSEATHFDYVRIEDYKNVKDISWFSVVGKDGSYTSLVFFYQRELRFAFNDMCRRKNISCNVLYDLGINCDQVGFPIWDGEFSNIFSPFLPSTRKWEVDCGTVQPEVIEIGR